MKKVLNHTFIAYADPCWLANTNHGNLNINIKSMAQKIITLGHQTRQYLVRGTSTTLTGDFREIRFPVSFVMNAVNGTPKIRITVSQVGRGFPEQIRIELIPPERTGLSLTGHRVRASDLRATTALAPRRLASATETAVTAEIGTAGGDATTTVFRLNTGFNPLHLGLGAFGDNILDPDFPRPPDLPPPPPIQEVYIHTLSGSDPQGGWKVRLHNLAEATREFRISVEYPESVQTLHTTRVPFQLLNRTFNEVLLLMSPSLWINQGNAVLSFNSEFKHLTGVDDQTFSVNSRLTNINLESYRVVAGKDADSGWPVIIAGIDLEERGAEVAVPGWDGNIQDLSVQIVLMLNLIEPPTTDFFQTALLRHNGTVIPRRLGVICYVYTDPDLKGIWVNVLDFLKDLFGGDSFEDTIEDMRKKMQFALNDAFRTSLSTHVQDVLTHLVEKDHALHSIWCDARDLIVKHHALPDLSGRQVVRPDIATEVIEAVMSSGTSDPVEPEVADDFSTHGAVSGSTSSLHRPVSGTAAFSSARIRPDASVVSAAANANRTRVGEGVIDHIVVLMLENRSFDHMLGYLALKGWPVRGLSGHESNSLDEGNPSYKVHHLKKTFGIPSPGHSFSDAAEQFADGKMTGFAQNYARRRSVSDPGLVMGYYTENDLPMYDFLVENFAVCDAWFSSHPGATWPNRFCATTGEAPDKDNFNADDERIGYFRGTSIFDWLTTFGVDWVCAEGNISFLRMFDRYRLDVRNIIPYRDDFGQNIQDTFINRVRNGKLPAVSFIDPRYIDIPPAWDANDDLPPADICHGQNLVKEVYQLLTGSAQTWSRTMFIVTYDEHGGFFDHVPPPGTAAAEDPSPLPLIAPNGATHLGARVPAFVVSPWVDAGSVITTQLEHTSIIRTILERFISKEHADQGVLGQRAAQANSLLPLSRTRPRTDIPLAPAVVCTQQSGIRGPAHRDDFHSALRYMGMPVEERRRLFGG